MLKRDLVVVGDSVGRLFDVVHAEVDVADVADLQRPERFGSGPVVPFPDHRRLGPDVSRAESRSGSVRGRDVERDADESDVEVEIWILKFSFFKLILKFEICHLKLN